MKMPVIVSLLVLSDLLMQTLSNDSEMRGSIELRVHHTPLGRWPHIILGIVGTSGGVRLSSRAHREYLCAGTDASPQLETANIRGAPLGPYIKIHLRDFSVLHGVYEL